MNESLNQDSQLKQLTIRLQNLRVLLEDATLRGSHHRMQELLADIHAVQNEVRKLADRNGTI
jgi:hypothetical protein